jgi:cytidyltransferase-like protein
MFINELAEPTVLVIYPGRFQPFHKGHHAVYEFLTGKFGRNNVYIATSNKVAPPKSPFTFADKAYFMQLTGVPSDRILQAANPYQIENILQTSNIQVDKNNTVVIFAVSQKDMEEDPRFSFKHKKDGSAPYFQPLRSLRDTKAMNEHGYIMTVPTFDFDVLGEPMRSGTELRKMYVEADESTRQAIVKDLFGRYTHEAEQLLTSKLAPPAPAEVARPAKLPKTVKPVGGQVVEPIKEEAGGTGVVASKKQARDPRYSMSLTKDVRPGQINKSLKAFKLAENSDES